MSIYLYMVCDKCRKSQRIGDSEGVAMRDFCLNEHYDHLSEVRVKDDRRYEIPYGEEESLEEEGRIEMKDEEAKIEEARKALRESIAKGLEDEAGRSETRRSEVASAGFNPSVVAAWEARRDTLYDVWARVRRGEWG